MPDNYPSQIPIEIDRERLRPYLRTRLLLMLCVGIGIYGGFLFALVVEENRHIRSHSTALAALCILVAVALAFLFLLVLFTHWIAGRQAASLHVSVEGAFLRIQQGTWLRTDRNLHFRAIVDYSTIQGPLMRHCGIEGLRTTTQAGGNSSFVNIFGVKDSLRVRDLLSDVDQLRENAG